MPLQLWRPNRSIRPWHPLESIDEIERRIEDLFGRELVYPSFWRQQSPTEEKDWVPRVEMIEMDDKYLIKAELPGMKKEDIDISVTGDTLTLKGHRQAESDIKEDDYHLCERSYGSFFRSITLPSSVKADEIEAKYEDGMIEVSLPKQADTQPKKIEVKVK